MHNESMKNLVIALSFLILSGCWAPSPENTSNKKEVVESMVAALLKQHPDSAGLNARELSQMLDDDSSPVILVDVRTPVEREVSTLPGAVSKETFHQRQEDRDESPLVVAYDTFGYRAIEWIENQKKDGLKNALYLEGGVIAWAHASGAFVNSKNQGTQKVHVLNEAWALLPDDYEAISE